MNHIKIDELIAHLHIRKQEHQDFAVSFALAVKELLNHQKGAEVLQLFREPDFQFINLSFDDASQIGVILGLHFNNYDNWEIEKLLLQENNFRDLVLKTNVEYTRFNANYGKWINYLSMFPHLDTDTSQFIRSIKPFMYLLNCQPIPNDTLLQIPPLRASQHPILFGRIFSLKIILTQDEKVQKRLIEQMEKRLANSPNLRAELMYVPAIHALLTQNETLSKFTLAELREIPVAQKWYQISLIAIEKIFIAACKIKKQQYLEANQLLASSPLVQIRFGYKYIVDLFITHFYLEMAKNEAHDPQVKKILQQEFKAKLTKVNLPLLSEAYFEGYFEF